MHARGHAPGARYAFRRRPLLPALPRQLDERNTVNPTSLALLTHNAPISSESCGSGNLLLRSAAQRSKQHLVFGAHLLPAIWQIVLRRALDERSLQIAAFI